MLWFLFIHISVFWLWFSIFFRLRRKNNNILHLTFCNLPTSLAAPNLFTSYIFTVTRTLALYLCLTILISTHISGAAAFVVKFLKSKFSPKMLQYITVSHSTWRFIRKWSWLLKTFKMYQKGFNLILHFSRRLEIPIEVLYTVVSMAILAAVPPYNKLHTTVWMV